MVYVILTQDTAIDGRHIFCHFSQAKMLADSWVCVMGQGELEQNKSQHELSAASNWKYKQLNPFLKSDKIKIWT